MSRALLASALLALAALAGGPLAHASTAPASSTAVQVARDLSYGADPRQRIDAYVPMHPTGPVLVMVHGGAWVTGDKSARAMIGPKVSYWTARGWVVVSANYRLLPAANPLEQAKDVGRALALVQKDAASWGADPNKVVLMGHSSGGHLVSLLNAAPQLAYAQGAKPWKATVNLDGAALNVPEIMQERHARLYDRAFGRDPAFWESVSPIHVLAKDVPPILFVCSNLRSNSCPQAAAYERKASLAHQRVTIWTQPKSHMEIDQQLGLPGGYTDSVDRWINSIL